MLLQVAAYGTLTALGGTDDGFAALVAGRDGFGPGPDWAPTDGPVACVREAIEAGNRTFALGFHVLRGLKIDPDGLAVVYATTTSAMLDGEAAIEQHERGQTPDRPIDFLWSHLTHRPAFAVRDRLGATGPALTVSTACTSGAVAIGIGADLVRSGRAKRAWIVASDGLCRTTLYGFRSLGAYSGTRCRPFDRGRDGMAIGEGAAYMVLEPAGERPRFTLLGVEIATDGHHLTAPDPEGHGVVRAVHAARGSVDPSEVDHVTAHATATEANDAAEAAALSRAAPGAAISATKGASGHTLGAAGLIEAVWLLQSMAASVIPPVVGLEDPLDVNVSAVARAHPQRVGVSVNLAFGGHNAAVAFRYDPDGAPVPGAP